MPIFTRALADPDSDVRYTAVWGLHSMGVVEHPEIISLLESAAQDPSDKVAETARGFLKSLKAAPDK
jgi:hypothetical protein